MAQSLAYVFTRRFMSRGQGGAYVLLGLSHVLMGVLSLLLLPLLWSPDWPAVSRWILPSLGAGGFYMAAQVGLFSALKRIEASRIAPLLGLKIMILAVVATLFLDQELGVAHWAAVFMSIAAALLLNEIGGRIPWQGLAGVAVAITGYTMSDLSIRKLVMVFEPVGPVGPFAGACVTYVLCGVLGVAMVARSGHTSRHAWRLAAPYALCWFVSMCCFYATITMIGIVFAVIVQSTRGVLSVGMGFLLAHMGHVHLERHTTPAVFWKRVFAAVLMVAAIALYSVA